MKRNLKKVLRQESSSRRKESKTRRRGRERERERELQNTDFSSHQSLKEQVNWLG